MPKPLSLRFSMQRDLTTLDPQKGADIATSSVHCLLFEGLMRPQSDNTPEPAQAKTVTVSPDGLTYTFVLRETLWSDGTPVTAFDFERSWKRFASPDFPGSNAHLLYPIKNAEKIKKGELFIDQLGVKAVNENTLVVKLEQRAPYFLEMMCFPCFYPVKNLSFDHPKELITNGPYRLGKWKFNNRLEFKKNSLYWDKNGVKAETIHVFIVDNENTALSMFEKNELDFIGGPLAPLPIDALKSLSQDKRLKIQPVGGSTVCVFNTHTFPFHNENMRKAFAYAISRQDILDTMAQKGESPASTIVPPVLTTSSKIFFKDHDIQLAQKHLALALQELNIPLQALNKLTYIYSGRQEHHHIAQILQATWKEVLGITVNLQSLERKMLLEKLKTKEFCFGQTIWLAQYNDPLAILERFKEATSSKNYSGWSNIHFVKCLEKSYQMMDKQDRMALLEEAEELLVGEVPLVPLYHWNYAFLIHENVKNLSFTPLGTINFAQIVVERSENE